MMTWNSDGSMVGGAICLIYSQTDNTDCHNINICSANTSFCVCKQRQLDLVRSCETARERGKKRTMIYSDLLRFVGLLAGGRPAFFQALVEQAFCPGAEQGDGSCRHLNTTLNHQIIQTRRHQVPPHVDIYLFLRLFRLLFLRLFLARGRRAVLLAENVGVLIILREQIDGFLGSDFLPLGCKKKGIKAVCAARASAIVSRNGPALTGLFLTFTAEEVVFAILVFKQTASTNAAPCRNLPDRCRSPVLFAPHGIRVVPRAKQVVVWREERIRLVEEGQGREEMSALALKQIPGKTDTAPARIFFPALSESSTEKRDSRFFRLHFHSSTGFVAHVSSDGASYLHSSGFHCGLFSLQPPEVLALQRTGHPGKYVRRHGLKC